ncbi:MAG: hypothetical protein E3J70_10445 [Candidatus Heimdallarchaeota archaeon]|nr:MAG: hypothetical protein E3J70_10445 [Candidatus Heimdallarchaeota archaeon]
MFSKIKSYVIIFIILATPLNSLFLSMLVSSPNSSSAILSNDYSEGTGDLSPNAENGLLWSSTSGLTGDLTTSPIIDFNTENELVQIVYIGTEIGLTKIQVETGNIYWTHPTPGAILSITPIDDTTGDSSKEVLITVDNQQFNNTEMLNGLTGEIIWSYRPTETVWQEGIGFSQQETRSWSGLLIEDISNDGTSDVLISSYKSVFALDAEDGSLLWQQSASNDVWNTELMEEDVDSDGYDDIAIGSQDGELILLNSQDGSIIWEIIAAEEAKYIDQTQEIEYTFDRNVYDVRKCFDMNGDGKKDILTTDENGYCAIYDVITGGLIDRVLAYSRTGTETDQASFGSKDFYNPMSMDVVDDYGLTKVLTASRSDAVFSNLTLSLLNLGMNDLNVDWSISSVNIEDVRSIATSVATEGNGTYTKMIIPTGTMGSSQFERTIEVYALNNSLIAQWNLTVLTTESDFQLNFGDTSDSQYPYSGNHAFFVRDFQGSPEEEVLIYLAGYGLFLLDGDTGDLLWSQIKSAKVKIEPYFDVNSDSTIDILRKEYYYLDQYSNDRFRIPRITMISGDSGETIWDHEIDYEDRELVGGGYLSILQAEDITNDSIPDLWLAQQEYDNWEFNLVNVSKVKLLDGATGAIVWESLPANGSMVYSREEIRLTSLSPIADQDNDEIQDILVGCQRGFIYCRSGFDGAPIWNITRVAPPFAPNYRNWIPYTPIISGVGNIQGNTTDDFVILGDGQVQLVDSDNFTTVMWSWFNPLGWIDEQNLKIHINWAQNELFAIFTINKNDKQYTAFIDLVTGTLDYEILGEETQFNIQFFAADFNLDGTNDHLLYRPWGSEDYMEGIYIIDGITGNVITFYSPFRPEFERWYWLVDQLFRMGADSFVDVYEDVTFDGIPEIVSGFSIGKHNKDEISQGMVVEIIDVTRIPAKAVIEYVFVSIEWDQYSHPPLLPAGYTRNIGDITGDGKAEILVSLITPEGEFKSTILDISEDGGVWKEISNIVFDSIIPQDLNGTLDGNLIVSDLYGRIRAVDNSFTVTINEFQAIREGVGQYYLEWSSNAAGVMSKIYIDHEVVSTVFTSEVEIFLSGGEHNLTVSVSDRNGISAFTNMIVLIEKGSGLLIVWLVVGVIIIGFIGLKLFFRFKRKEDLTDFGPDAGGA